MTSSPAYASFLHDQSFIFYLIATAIWQYSQGVSTLSLSLPVFILIVIIAYLLAWIPTRPRFTNNDKETVCE